MRRHPLHRSLARAIFPAAMIAALPACGSAQPPAAAPPTPAPPPSSPEPSAAEPAPPPQGDETEASEASAPEPEFTPGMSVDEAVNAVPRHAERLNLDEATLGRPLVDFAVYEPCKPAENQKFSVRVAVWQGKAVGVDVRTTPPNEPFARCVDERVRAIQWRDRVPSLNIVEYSF